MDIQQQDEAITIDKISMLHKNIPFVLIATMLGSLPLAMVVWNSGEDESLRNGVFAWVVLHVVFLFSRGLHHLLFDKTNATLEEFLRYDLYSIAFVLLAGCLWGLAGYLFFDADNVPTYSFLILTLVCMVSGSMNALSPRPWHFAVFVIPTMAPIIILTLLQNTLFYFLMGAAATAYVMITIIFNRNLYNTIHESLSLKHQNTQLIDDLQTQTNIANQANIDKSRFLAAASHDLRQPLHATNLFSDVLENEIEDPQQQKLLGHIRHGLFSMGELFDALLDVARIDANETPVNLDHFSVNSLIHILINQFSIDAETSGIEIRYTENTFWTYSDPILLEQILRNLVSNAIKYTNKGYVEISCKVAAKETLAIHVKDTGIGIAEQDVDRVFEEFTQINNPERDRTKGLGLGLAIVKRLTHLLNHSLGVESELGVGSEFILEIPLRSAPTGHEERPILGVEICKLQEIRILLIDNEAEIVEATRLLLTNWGCDVTVCTNTADALALVKRDKTYDVIFSDFRMAGELNGVELIQKIRRTRPSSRGVIVSGDKDSKVSKLTQEADLILLHKPVRPAQISEALMRILDNV